MEELIMALPWVLTGLVFLSVLLLLKRPICCLGGLAARTGISLAVLFLLQRLGGLAGISLGVNLFNALVMGVLGLPGFGLLLMLNWSLAL